jgi:hypothetical protein
MGGVHLLAVTPDRLLILHCSNGSGGGSSSGLNAPAMFAVRPCNPAEPLMLSWLSLARSPWPSSELESAALTSRSRVDGDGDGDGDDVGHAESKSASSGAEVVDHIDGIGVPFTTLADEAAVGAALTALAASYMAPRGEATGAQGKAATATATQMLGRRGDGASRGRGTAAAAAAAAAAVATNMYPLGQVRCAAFLRIRVDSGVSDSCPCSPLDTQHSPCNVATRCAVADSRWP